MAKRQPIELWQEYTRPKIWERDKGRCQGPYCLDKEDWSLPLAECHIDHIQPLSHGGMNTDGNLRVLCARCHCLRGYNSHNGLRAWALNKGIIPSDWRPLVWWDD